MGKQQKAPCKKKLPHSQSEKPGLLPAISVWHLQVIFSAQTIASSFGIAEMGIPFYGLYGACSTMGESLSLGAIAVSAGYGAHILCATSSHFATAEKEFRFPLGYGSQRPLSATWTVTGSGACVIGAKPPCSCSLPGSSPLAHTNGYAAITGITTGKGD